MNAHSLKVLEYRKVLDRLAAHTSNRLGHEAAFALTPTHLLEIVLRRLKETREAKSLLDSDTGMPLGGIHDIRAIVERAQKTQVLTAGELLDVGATAAASRRLKTYLLKRAEIVPLLAEIAGNIPQFPMIESAVADSISDGGEVRDSATPELARVRGQLKVVQARLRERLNTILGSEKYRSFIQESLMTLREGRFCIPVKAEYRTQFGGIVHDASASGATVFVEPGACVDMGNELKELTVKEEHEVFRILTRLSDLVGKSAQDLTLMLEILSNLDLANAKALLAIEMQAAEPEINSNGTVRLRGARHPLLSGEVVPIDIEVGDRFNILLITGPNTGGKTVALKTIGLLTLMAQSGLQIPASPDSTLSIFEHVFADIGDEQDIQQSLSTFSAHLKNITKIVETLSGAKERKQGARGKQSVPNAQPSTLVLLDELGAGTDPAEGAALAKALLDTLNQFGARVIATTHYGELKEFAYSHPGVENASVEFDRDTLRPTYRVLLGVPGSSNAFYIAGRLGLPQEIVEAARGYLSKRDQTTGELLQQIEESRRKTFELEKEASRAREEAEADRDEYERRVREVSDIQRSARQAAEEEARAIVRKASDRTENILAELRKKNRGTKKGTSARRQLADLRREVSTDQQNEEPESLEPALPDGHVFKKGDRVRVTTWGLDGEVLSEPADGTVEVQMGAMRATLPVDILRPMAEKPPQPSRAKRSSVSEMQMRKAIHISSELMLRAMRVDEAAPLLDKYVDDAYAAGLQQAKIIHGKGTGALRKYVWEYLKDHPVVKSFRIGEEGEGGDGATVVSFKD